MALKLYNQVYSQQCLQSVKNFAGSFASYAILACGSTDSAVPSKANRTNKLVHLVQLFMNQIYNSQSRIVVSSIRTAQRWGQKLIYSSRFFQIKKKIRNVLKINRQNNANLAYHYTCC